MLLDPPAQEMMSPSSRRQFSANNTRAFTIVELLTVTAIMALMMALAGNIMRMDARRANVSAAIDDFSGVLHQARWEARSKGTYVWVCLKSLSGATPGVQVVTLASRDGTSDSSPANLIQAASRSFLEQVILRDVSNGTPARLVNDYLASSIDSASAVRLGGATLVISDGSQNSFSNYIIQFNPRGEVSIPGNDLGGFIEVLFSPGVVAADSDTKSSSILLSRATGSAQIYR